GLLLLAAMAGASQSWNICKWLAGPGFLPLVGLQDPPSVGGATRRPPPTGHSSFLFVSFQVVAGVKYYLTVLMAKTRCRKSRQDVDFKDCPLASSSKQEKLICEFQVWSRPWLNDTQLVHQSCKPAT
uniref:Cystatin domain-containing protein n=1 Tax=Sphenodon punctatus TaxID=8508 RepID=A0A8D0GWS6_SPHPU